jgi:glyoxylase-like metal-dependent hydrolase (beta-lactamase superfamily II)
MTEITRRTVLSGAVAASAAVAFSPLASTPAAASAAAAGKQNAGWYRYKVGSLEVTVVTDGARVFPLPDTFVRNAKKEEVSAALQASFLPGDTLTVPFNPTVINTGQRRILIDTGLGAAAFAQSKGAMGQMNSNLAAAGFDPKSIDAVIISHFHPDHINGLLDADGKPVFANAELMVPAAEWKFWMDEGAISRAPEGVQNNAKNVRRVFGPFGNKVTQYDAGKEIAPGITSMATYGHTPGHTSHVISSGSESVLVQADVTNVPFLFVRNPDWHVMFDMNGAEAAKTRRQVYDKLVADKMKIQGFHYPFPAVGHIERDGQGYRVVPALWQSAI